MSPSSTIAHEAIFKRGAMQKTAELTAFLDYLIQGPPIHNVVEIGSMFGGMLWALSNLVSQPAKMVAVDKFVLEGRLEFATGFDYHLVMGDSGSDETRLEVMELLKGEPIDLLFIDGDHSYDAVLADWNNFNPLVAPNRGIIAFHDVCHRQMINHDMWRVWERVKREAYGKHHVIFDPPNYPSNDIWGGIGILDLSGHRLPPKLRAPDNFVPYQPWTCERCGNRLVLGEEIVCTSCA